MTAGVIGCGLIGGSIGLAMRAAGNKVIGSDPSNDHLKLALERGCLDEVGSTSEAAQAEVCFLAVPPGQVIAVVEEALSHRGEGTVLTDCTSVKSEIASWLDKHPQPMFVPGHPMAGHEKSGPKFASAWMFRNAKWILCPHKSTSKEAIKRVASTVEEMGAKPIRLTASDHDHTVGILSHLPHVLAALLAQTAQSLESTEASAGSWKDLTRVAGVDPGLWSDILFANRRQLISVLDEFGGRLSEVKTMLQASSPEGIHAFLTEVAQQKEKKA